MAPAFTVTSADGVDIAVHELGGGGDPLLIAHATGFCAGMYGPMALGLTGRFRVVALDFRGHGDSGRPDDDDFDWAGMAADLHAVVDRLDAGPVHAVGHSMGGASILHVERDHPGSFRSAFLFEPIVVPPAEERTQPNDMADTARARRATFPDRPSAFYHYAARPPLGQLRADVLRAYVDEGFADLDDGTIGLKCRPDDEARTFASDTKMTYDELGDIEVPAVVATGRDDGEEPSPASFAPRVAAALPEATLTRFDTLGHLGPFQDPAAVAAAALAHIDAVEADR